MEVEKDNQYFRSGMQKNADESFFASNQLTNQCSAENNINYKYL
jgi:hypothetical protein